MPRKKPEFRPEQSSRREQWLLNALWWTIATALFVIPLIIDPLAKDWFRLPKEIAFRLFAIITGTILVLLWTFQTKPFGVLKSLSKVNLLLLMIVGWTALTTITSTNRVLSFNSLITVGSAAILFAGARVAFRHCPSMRSFDIVLPAAVLTAFLAISQKFGFWQPFDFPEAYPPHLLTTALLGNPNDVGMYLVLPAAAAVVAALASTRGSRRIGYSVVSVVLFMGLVACGSRAALGAWTLGVLVAIASWRRQALLLAILSLSLFLAFSTGFHERVVLRVINGIVYEDYVDVFSERMPAILTAIEMTRDHLIFGAGPGTFKWNYFEYRLQVGELYDDRWVRGSPLTFMEAHNDHLQILCETGLPGYGFLVVGMALLISGRRGVASTNGLRSNAGDSVGTSDEFDTFARRLIVPISLALVVIMVPQFPLQLAASRTVILSLLAICTWKDP